ncbi:hypothetical protein BB341_16780 [Streptomyces clavuligerus]|nr:hypothetical protein BB341_16780 [Streptomyces clavuligerus]
MPELRRTPQEGVLGRRHRLQGLRLLPQRQQGLLVEQHPRRRVRFEVVRQQALGFPVGIVLDLDLVVVFFVLVVLVFFVLVVLVFFVLVEQQLRRLTSDSLPQDPAVAHGGVLGVNGPPFGIPWGDHPPLG